MLKICLAKRVSIKISLWSLAFAQRDWGGRRQNRKANNEKMKCKKDENTLSQLSLRSCDFRATGE